MSHNSPRPLRLTPAAMSREQPTAEAVAMRQLRHQTKNALQRIIAQVAACDLRATPAGAVLADEIERRVCLSARVSDALFGLTASPPPLRQRLVALGDATIKLLADQEQSIGLDVTVTGPCPPAYEDLIVRIAHEMLGNAVKHGMLMRLVGHIALRVHSHSDGATELLVSDDGWGLGPECEGDGLPIMRCLAEQEGGQIAISRLQGWTVASLILPALCKTAGRTVHSSPRQNADLPL